jgi:hypothetical protein
VRDHEITKTCSKCGEQLTYFSKTWKQMEWANDKHFPAKHGSESVRCGGEFEARMARIGRAS